MDDAVHRCFSGHNKQTNKQTKSLNLSETFPFAKARTTWQQGIMVRETFSFSLDIVEKRLDINVVLWFSMW